ncbi:MAG: response regulator transcription factor [Acidobacteriaceae bacterium]
MPSEALIAVIEDEAHLAQGLIFNLEAEGYRTHHEADGDAALAWLLETTAPGAPNPPAAVLLDVMLPGRDGFSIVSALREAGRYTPVLILTARGRSEDVVEGFAAGADDYLPKPFELNVLFARLTALLRRMHWQATTPAPDATTASTRTEPTPTFTLANRVIDLDALEIRPLNPSEESASPTGDLSPLGWKIIHLTLMEADLLRYLLDHPNKIVARSELLEKVWHVKEDTDTRAIDNFIVRLRRYLEPDPAKPVHLLTIRGIGYRFVP